MKTSVKLGFASVAAVLVSGCSLFNGNQRAHLDLSAETDLATYEAVADINLEVGRENLRTGNLATAARYLRQAQTHPSTRAQASNALGVVYVRLGRLDLAQRYFAEAIDADPENARYMTNLARLERDVSFASLRASTSEVRTEALAESSATREVPEERGQAAEAAPSAQIQVSRPGVIHINTMDTPESAPQIQVVERREVVQDIARTDSDDEDANSGAATSRVKVVSYPIWITM